MRQSILFTKTRKEGPKDEVAKNAVLLIRAGFIHKEMAGVYSYLPLGLRVLKNIENIIREEMNAIGGQELLLTALQDKALWEKTNRWSDEVVDNWFKTKLKNNTEVGLGFTHEEPLTAIMSEYVNSYRDLPLSAYQFQTKFRNEARAKSGIMRGREFLMKDLYSFSKDQKEHEDFYAKAQNAYKNIFNRLGIGDKTHLTYATGGTFSKYSHEYQTVTSAGEDAINICTKCGTAINSEIIKEQKTCPQCNGSDFTEEKAVEVGNIFNLGTKFSDALGLTYLDEKGEKRPVIMGCYGIGLGRVLGTVAEVLADEKGIVWPESITPYKYHIIYIPGKNLKAKEEADDLYKTLLEKNIEVLYDDRDIRAGEKFADSDLIGISTRIVISDKSLEEDKLEIKNRKTGEVNMLEKSEFLKSATK